MTALDAARLHEVAPHEPTHRHLLEVVGEPIILSIGSTGAEAAIAGLHVARTYGECTARLVCAVVPADTAVARALQRQAAELALPDVHVLTPDDAELVACLHVARVVVGAPALAGAFGVATLDLPFDACPTQVAVRFAEVE